MAVRIPRLLAALVLAPALVLPPTAAAQVPATTPPGLDTGTSRVVDLADVTTVPAFDGEVFGDTGAYTLTAGRLHGVVDPADPRNASITDLQHAPRNAQGLVEYAGDFRLYTPNTPARGNGGLFAEVVNRGRFLGDGWFGHGFLFEQGYSVLLVGWQGDLVPDPALVRLHVPTATTPQGPITGPVRAEFVNNGPAAVPTLPLSAGAFTGTNHLAYPAATLSTTSAVLTQRVREEDPREVVPEDQWSFASCPPGSPATPSATDICFPAGFATDRLYELVYPARDPLVLGVGFAALRDSAVFFRTADADDDGTPNPLAIGPKVRWATLFGVSQAGRAVRSFLQQGFNRDARGGRVYEALWPEVATGKMPLSVRFGQPGRAYGQHEDHLYPTLEFPFAYDRSRDPVTGREAGLLDACRASDTCPKVFHTVHATEYWQGKQSLGQTDPLGQHDRLIPPEVRMYFLAGTQHGPAATPSRGICQQLSNPAPVAESLRALSVALEAWVLDGTPPPDNRLPQLLNGTLVPADQRSAGFPAIPGVAYPGLVNEGEALEFGPRFDEVADRGVIDLEPPRVLGSYRVLVPATDSDGNDRAGLRSTTLRVPLGTYTGWNLRAPGYAAGELCGLTGSYVPFVETRAERVAAGDPRPSLEERYGTHDGYVTCVEGATARLVAERLLLPADAQRLVAQARDSDVLRTGTGNPDFASSFDCVARQDTSGNTSQMQRMPSGAAATGGGGTAGVEDAGLIALGAASIAAGGGILLILRRTRARHQ